MSFWAVRGEIPDDVEDFDPAGNWFMGFHVNKDGDEVQLEDMTLPHLLATIGFFQDQFDVTPLRAELARRKKKQGNKAW